MDGKAMLGRLEYLSSKNRLLLIAMCLMLAFNLMNWMSLAKAKAATQIVMVPIGGGAGMAVGDGKASEAYLRQMARLTTDMMGNYTAATLRAQLEELLPLYPPDRVAEAQRAFEDMAQDAERFPGIAFTMHWTGDKPLKFNSNVIQVRVLSNELVDGMLKGSRNLFYCIHYQIDDTRFYLLSVIQKEGTADDQCFVEKAPPPKADNASVTAQPGSGAPR